MAADGTGTKRSRFLGCLLGGAVGDAMGAPVEFMRRDDILRRFGPAGITAYAPAYGGIGKFTDDTQMALFTAEGLLRGWMRDGVKGICQHPGTVGHAYLRWLQTQRETPHPDLVESGGDQGWLIDHPELHDRRGPGNTCLTALRAMRSYAAPAQNDSKGCGGVMRAAPVGLFAAALGSERPVEETFQLAVDIAALTHGHPTGSLTAGFLAVIIKSLATGAPMVHALVDAKRCLITQRRHEETLAAVEKAVDLAATATPPEASIALLGQGWVAEEALAISLYCALVARDFRHGVLLAVNHDGDSDSTGAITGNLLGTQWGVQAIPADWLSPLELRDVISEVAEHLLTFPDWPLEQSTKSPEFTRLWRKYPGY